MAKCAGLTPPVDVRALPTVGVAHPLNDGDGHKALEEYARVRLLDLAERVGPAGSGSVDEAGSTKVHVASGHEDPHKRQHGNASML